MSVQECSGPLRSVQDHSWELKSTHEYGAMGPWDLWVLITPFSWVLMSAIECAWVLMAPWHHAHLCSYLVIAAHEYLWALMNNYEGSRELISCHKCQEQPSSAMSTLKHGAKVPNALMTTHTHTLALLRMASTTLMSTHSTMATYCYEC